MTATLCKSDVLNRKTQFFNFLFIWKKKKKTTPSCPGGSVLTWASSTPRLAEWRRCRLQRGWAKRRRFNKRLAPLARIISAAAELLIMVSSLWLFLRLKHPHWIVPPGSSGIWDQCTFDNGRLTKCTHSAKVSPRHRQENTTQRIQAPGRRIASMREVPLQRELTHSSDESGLCVCVRVWNLKWCFIIIFFSETQSLAGVFT